MLTAAAAGAIGRGGWALITVIIPPLRSSLYLALIIALNGRENKPLSGKRPGQTAAEATTRSPMSGALVPGRVRSRSAKGQEAGWVGNPAGRSLGDVTCTYYGI